MRKRYDETASAKAPMQSIIRSLLDTDLYKFTMWQTMLHRHPQTQAEYTFVCRNIPAYPLADLLGEVNRELDALCALKFRPDELAYLGSPTGRQIVRRAAEQGGFVLEERADGLLLVDPDGIATDSRFPDDSATARVAAEQWKPKPLDAVANAVDVPDEWQDGKDETAVDMDEAIGNVRVTLDDNRL